MPSHHLWAPLTSLSLLHAGKNLLYQFAAISHWENRESPLKCFLPSNPVPCPECKYSPYTELAFHNCIFQAIYTLGPLCINQISNLYLSAATVPWLLIRELCMWVLRSKTRAVPSSAFTSASCRICTSVLPSLTRVIAHHLGTGKWGIWKGLCMEGRLTQNWAVWLENMGGMIVVFTAMNSSVRIGQSLPFFPPFVWKAKHIFHMSLL